MKFKVFDKEKKEFVDSGTFLLTSEGGLVGFNETYGLRPAGRYSPIFSTGQKDIEGIELYEGDVLAWDDREGHIFFENGCWFVKNFHNWSFDYPIMPFMEHTDFKKIGSIHTNPELLEG